MHFTNTGFWPTLSPKHTATQQSKNRNSAWHPFHQLFPVCPSNSQTTQNPQIHPHLPPHHITSHSYPRTHALTLAVVRQARSFARSFLLHHRACPNPLPNQAVQCPGEQAATPAAHFSCRDPTADTASAAEPAAGQQGGGGSGAGSAESTV